MRSLRFACLVALVALRSGSLQAAGTAFTYQGSLENPPGTPLSGTCTFAFKLCDDAAATCAPGTVSSHSGIEVVGGVFTVLDVDFGASAIDGTARWLEITVHCGNPGDPITLAPRQKLAPAPHALALPLPGLFTQQNATSPNIVGGIHENLVTAGVVGATISGGGTSGEGINRVTDNFGTVGGGAYNQTHGDGCTVGGGIDNRTSIGDGATVGGGYFNTADDYFATVSGGVNNFAGSHASTVGGGSENTASGEWSVVGGGNTNSASGGESAIGGGGGNTSGGQFSTVPGGRSNDAGGDYSFAAGRQAKANHSGTFVWADSTGSDFNSTSPDQFLIRAPGGVGIGTNAPAAQLDVTGTVRATNVEITGGFEPESMLAGWGWNAFGQTNVPFFDTFVAVAGGGIHSLALRNDGTLVAWGLNDDGLTDAPAGTFIDIAAGVRHNIAIRSDQTVTAWGLNDYGQTDAPLGSFAAVSGGDHHSVGIRTDGTLVGWGANYSGQIDVPSGIFTAVSAGHDFNVALRDDGSLAAWGRNNFGQTNVPVGSFVAVAAGGEFGIGIRADGTLAAWGHNDSGEVSGIPAGTFVAIAAGYKHGLAIRNDGTLVGWGRSNELQLDVPVGTYVAVAAGSYHSLAISSNAPPPGPAALCLRVDSAIKPGTNTWTIYSDRRLKKDITPLSGALEQLLQLQGVTFHWRDPASQGGITATQMGLIADDVQRVFPQWVGRDPKGYQTLTVGGFEALTAEAFRELRAEKDRELCEKDREIENLGSEISNLKSEISDLKEAIRKIGETPK